MEPPSSKTLTGKAQSRPHDSSRNSSPGKNSLRGQVYDSTEDPFSSDHKKRSINSSGKLKLFLKSASRVTNAADEEFNTTSQAADGCQRCLSLKDSTIKLLNHLKTYIDVINERINMFYHRINPSLNKNVSTSNNNSEIEILFSPEYYHTLYYSDLDKIKVNSEVMSSMRNVMKSIRLFNDKFEYISSKHENYGKLLGEIRNFKYANKLEENPAFANLPDPDSEEIKNLEVKTIFKNFNNSKDNFESILRDIKELKDGKSNIQTEQKQSNKSSSDYLEINSSNYVLDKHEMKDSYIRNEVSRLSKENTSLKLELNFMYEQLREENKIYEIKGNEKLKKDSKKKITSIYSNNSSNASKDSPNVVIKVEGENAVENNYCNTKQYINLLKQCEFFL